MRAGAAERLEDAVRKDGEVCAVANEMFEPGVGEGRRGVRCCGGNWDPVVEDGESSWEVVEVTEVVGEVGVRGELGAVNRGFLGRGTGHILVHVERASGQATW